MKYIRTREGIFVFAERFNLEHYHSIGFSDEDIAKKFTRNGNRLSDSIEDLCDAAIVDHTICIDHEWGGADWEKAMKLKSLFPNSKLRGAIWTAEGLIYVAEMNDEGKLELL